MTTTLPPLPAPNILPGDTVRVEAADFSGSFTVTELRGKPEPLLVPPPCDCDECREEWRA